MIELALCLVVAIGDGDTLKVRCGQDGSYQQTTIRLAEIDAPEKGQPYARRATASLAAVCFGAWATVSAEKKDRYGRTVARVRCRGSDASEEQVRNGMAWAYTQYLTDGGIRTLESEARQGQMGLWADASAMPPWQFRAAKRAKGGKG